MARSKDERSREILGLLAALGEVSVEQIEVAIGSSPATVRRDLDALESAGLLERTRGGARARNLAYSLTQRYSAASSATDAKLAIARAASEHVRYGDTIALSGGTTTTLIAQALAQRTDLVQPDRPGGALTVVTNAVNIAADLAMYPSISVIMTGGRLHPYSYELVGPVAEQTLQGLSTRLAFLGVNAIAANGSFRVTDESEAAVNSGMARGGDHTYVVADGSKFDQSALVALTLPRNITLITSSDAPSDRVADMRIRGVQTVVVATTPAVETAGSAALAATSGQVAAAR